MITLVVGYQVIKCYFYFGIKYEHVLTIYPPFSVGVNIPETL